jgi:hypothetical protein
MKAGTLGATLAGAMAAAALASGAQATTYFPLVTADENGHGRVDLCGGGCPAPMPSAMAADPGPGGAASALTYNLLSPPSLETGDVLIYRNGQLDDVIRFEGAGASASLVFYSAPSGGALADVGFPSSFYANSVSLNEVHGKVFYNPSAREPGYITPLTNYPFNVAYSIASVPEPGAWAMMLIGLAGLGALARGRRMQPAGVGQ